MKGFEQLTVRVATKPYSGGAGDVGPSRRLPGLKVTVGVQGLTSLRVPQVSQGGAGEQSVHPRCYPSGASSAWQGPWCRCWRPESLPEMFSCVGSLQEQPSVFEIFFFSFFQTKAEFEL